ncbi:helix-turn-helix domain-containing protein [Streptomyces durbertensis]|uniref:Helix-turn-helix domain-containing protein n=1 Tax=Streptomyces durbertensis TaxID=2448886 RepID=A0ABR6EKJ6_9ACTN|nr:helix-turn-helix transcriptional regulator [Streptomyces durbertensis]MBB1245846.1 helix-turn-helix domain-containing protein [Streptomyces durbertensis]
MHAVTDADIPVPAAVGEHIATLRKARDLSQRVLARKASISHSLLSKIEVGDRACRPAVAAALAEALGVTLSVLYGQPYAESPGTRQIDQLRSAVRRHRHPAVADVHPRTLAADVHHASRLRAATDYATLLDVLPPLISRAVAHAHDTREPGAWQMLVDVYACAYTIAHRLGYPDLADLVAARQEWAASQAWVPVAQMAAAWTEAGTFQSAGDYLEGLAVTDRALTTWAASGENSVEAVVAAGSLHLRAVTLAARARDEATARHHLVHAKRLAGLLDQSNGDEYRHNLTFGAGNVALHEMAAQIELEKPKRAVTMADGMVGQPPSGLGPTRVGHLHIDAARAHLATGDREEALRSLFRAREAAPQMARIHPMAREVLRVLVSLHRRSKPELTRLAKWAGLHG